MGFYVFAILALYVDAAGKVGGQLRSVLRICFGDLAVLYASILVLLALHIFRGKKWPPSVQRGLGLTLLLGSATLVFHMLYYRGYQFPPNLMEEISYARRGEGAGVLGAVLLVFSYNAFGIHGTYVLVATMVLLGLIFLFRISLLALVQYGAKYVWDAFCRFWHGQIDGYHEWKDERKRRRLEKQTLKEPVVEAEPAPKPVRKPRPKRKEAKKKEEPEAKEEAEQTPEQLVLNLPAGEEKGAYTLPPTYLLKQSGSRTKRTEGVQTELLEDTLASFGIEAKVVNVSQGPVVTRYELQPAPGIKV